MKGNLIDRIKCDNEIWDDDWKINSLIFLIKIIENKKSKKRQEEAETKKSVC